MYVDFGGICNFRFNAYYIYVRVLFDDFFPNSEIKKEPIHVPIIKKIICLERTQYAFLDHSKPLFLVISSK